MDNKHACIICIEKECFVSKLYITSASDNRENSWMNILLYHDEFSLDNQTDIP